MRRHRTVSAVAPLRGPPAVVVGLDSLQGLQSARILAERGIPTIGVAKDRRHYACRTRVCDRVVFADTGGDDLVEALVKLGSTLPDKPVLIPCQDKNVLLVSRHRERLARCYRFSLPRHDVVELLLDKAKFYPFAEQLGLRIPATHILRSFDDALTAATTKMEYPAILKPSYRLREWSKHTKEKGVIIEGPDHLISEYRRLAPWSEALILQQLVRGPATNHFTCNLYLDAASEPLVTFTSQKLRQWAPDTGQACSAQEAENEDIVAEAVRLFQHLDCHGLAYLETKRDEESGEVFVIEPNIGRPTGRASFAEHTGVELLYTAYCDAVGLPLPDDRIQRYGAVKWVHLSRDLQALFHLRRRGELTVRGWWRSLHGRKAFAILSVSDPLPFLSAVWRQVSPSRFWR